MFVWKLAATIFLLSYFLPVCAANNSKISLFLWPFNVLFFRLLAWKVGKEEEIKMSTRRRFIICLLFCLHNFNAHYDFVVFTEVASSTFTEFNDDLGKASNNLARVLKTKVNKAIDWHKLIGCGGVCVKPFVTQFKPFSHLSSGNALCNARCRKETLKGISQLA